MKAQAGDHIVIASPTTGGAVRDGEIMEVRGTDGAPPYVVRWADSGSVGLYFPGSDARLTSHPAASPDSAGSDEPTVATHARSWRVNIDLFEREDETTAHAVLVAEAPQRLEADGRARRNPADVAVPQIGDEIAVARALRRLSDRLFETASSDISGVEGGEAIVSQ
jgi:hypothetical protein